MKRAGCKSNLYNIPNRMDRSGIRRRGRHRAAGITISPPLKASFFLMFLFAIGYGVGPQFVRGIAKDGVPQAMFCGRRCMFCLLAALSAREGRRL